MAGPTRPPPRTSEPSELLFLSIDDFQRLYRQHPEIADAVIRNLGIRLRKLVKVVETMALEGQAGRGHFDLQRYP